MNVNSYIVTRIFKYSSTTTFSGLLLGSEGVGCLLDSVSQYPPKTFEDEMNLIPEARGQVNIG